jgi:Ala-tRNA(Pro) deacylase
MLPRAAVHDFLERHRIPYAAVPHRPAYTAQEEAAAAHIPGRDWAKTVVCVADDRPVLAVVPAPLVVDLDKLCALTGARHLRLANEAEMERWYPECEVGAVPPLGALYGQQTFVDRRLAAEPEIAFSAGTHTDAVRIPYAAYASATHPFIGDFGVARQVAASSVEDGRSLW